MTLKNIVVSMIVSIVVGCGSSGDPTPSAPTAVPSSAADPVTPPTAPAPVDTTTPPSTGPSGFSGHCGDPVPAGATEAIALPTYAGTCPAFAAAPNDTTITTSGLARKFILVTPATPPAGKALPVVFAWHWLNASGSSFFRQDIDIQDVANKLGIVFIVPEVKGDDKFDWPYALYVSDARLEEEAKFADDALACVAAAMPVDKNCVASMGVSAGALFTDQLAQVRANRLASLVSVSGGVGNLIRGWDPAKVTHKMPGLVVWGGPTDNLVAIDFTTESKRLEDGLVLGGEFVLECVHNCGHAAPPLDAPPAGVPHFAMLWQFVLDHPYWTSPGASPYQTAALPPSYPSWCAVGKGNAKPRTGDCAAGSL